MVKRTVIEEDDTAERAREVEELAQLNADEDGALFRISDELRQTAGVTAMIVCLAPAEKEGYVADLPIQEFSVGRLKRLYGPGRYKIRFNGPKGFIPGGGTIKIAEISTDSAATVLPLDSDRERRERKAEERIDKLWEVALIALPAVITGLFNRPAAPAVDIAALANALKPAPGPSLADLAGTLVSMKALSAPTPQESTIDQALKIMERVSDMGDGGGKSGGGSNWLDVLRDVVKEAGPALKPVLDNLAARATPPQPIQAQVMEPEPPAQIAQPAPLMEPVPNPQPEETDAMSLFMPIIKSHLAKVYGWAAGDRDPELYAEVFFEELPRELGTYIDQTHAVEYINHPQWFEYVTQVEPRLASKKEWLEKFRKELLEIFGNIPVESTETNPEA